MTTKRRTTSKPAGAQTARGVPAGRPRGTLEGSAPPRYLADLSDRLSRCVGRGPKGAVKVARYAMAHPYDIAFGTARDIAARCAVSTTPVVRLALKLGFEGFRDMREFFRSALRDHVSPSRQSLLDEPVAQRDATPESHSMAGRRN